MPRKSPPEARFWNLVNGPWCDPRLDPYESCWRWMGARIKSKPPKSWLSKSKPWREYGRFHWDTMTKLLTAHRAALLLTVGPPPPSLEEPVATHNCDDPLCVHPGHLKWATQRANIEEAIAKGRLKRIPNPRRQSGTRYATTGLA